MIVKSINLSVLTTLSLFAVVLLMPEVAHAQNSEWVKPATGLIEALRSGLVQIGAIVIGLAVIGVGIYITFSGEPNFKRLGMIIFGGLLIIAGPESIALLLEATS